MALLLNAVLVRELLRRRAAKKFAAEVSLCVLVFVHALSAIGTLEVLLLCALSMLRVHETRLPLVLALTC